MNFPLYQVSILLATWGISEAAFLANNATGFATFKGYDLSEEFSKNPTEVGNWTVEAEIQADASGETVWWALEWTYSNNRTINDSEWIYCAGSWVVDPREYDIADVDEVTSDCSNVLSSECIDAIKKSNVSLCQEDGKIPDACPNALDITYNKRLDNRTSGMTGSVDETATGKTLSFDAAYDEGIRRVFVVDMWLNQAGISDEANNQNMVNVAAGTSVDHSFACLRADNIREGSRTFEDGPDDGEFDEDIPNTDKGKSNNDDNDEDDDNKDSDSNNNEDGEEDGAVTSFQGEASWAIALFALSTAALIW